MNSVVTAYPDALPEATSTSLSLPETLTFEQWEQIGAELANRARKLNWWIGDWWAAGHHRYGERARLAAKGLFGKEFKTLANIASVCRAFDPSRRREHLSWSHHAEAAALSPNAADMLLDLAERDRMSKAQVRAAVTTIRGGPPSRTAPDQAAVANIFRSYNRLPGEVRLLVAQAFAAANGAAIDPATGEPQADIPGIAASNLDDATADAAALGPDLDMAQRETVPDTELEAELRQPESEPDTTFDLAPDMEAAAGEAETEITFDPALETAVVLPEADTYTTFDLEPDLDGSQAAEADIAFDLTLDMADLQLEVAPANPLDLDSAMEVQTERAEPDTAFDLELEMAVTPSEAMSNPAFDLDADMEVLPGGEEPLELDAMLEKKQEEEEDEASPSSKTEPWLLP